MVIQVDTREHSKAIKGILAEFDRQGIKHISSKLYVGDYVNIANPFITVDRKQNIREWATNCTSGSERVSRELQRAKDIGMHVIFLIEEATIDGKPIHSYEDLMLWEPPEGQGTVSGMRVFRQTAAWIHKYGIEVKFCKRSETGKVLIDLLGGGTE